MSIPETSPEEQALNLIAPRKLHQIFTLPDTDKHGVLKVTYAIAGPDIGEDVPTILFCGVFGTRYMAVWYNLFAEKQRVRIVFIDRPAFGGSTPVPVSQRLPVFLETIPALLKHLNIPSIHLASHSAGTVYVLNLLWYHPELLSPENPTVHFFSPWVHQSISSVSFLSAAAMLPNSLLNHWDSVVRFVVGKATPAFTGSSAVLSSSLGLFDGKTKKLEDGRKKEDEERKYLECYGFSLAVKQELDKLYFKYSVAESFKGGNDEARLCLKSTAGTSWDACEDYVELVGRLKELWEKRVQEGWKKLRIQIVFGEEDVMIGNKGRRYWESCWTPEKCGSGIEVESGELKGGDHESVIDATKGPLSDMCAATKVLRG